MMQCDERARLERAYLEAASKIQEAGSHIPEMTSAAWKIATSAARAASRDALEALKRHRQEHSC
jgi:hypothetical protein